MTLTDTHCHLNFDSYQNDLDQVLSRAWEWGLERIMIPGLDVESSRQVIALAASDPRLFAAVGVHPNSVQRWEEGSLMDLQELTRHPQVAAVGEIGLDYYRSPETRDLQMQVLETQLKLASERKLPVIVHVRNASEDDRSCIIDLTARLAAWHDQLAEEGCSYLEHLGVVHSFSGTPEEGARLQSLGFYLGITGPVTYPNGQGMRDVVRTSDRDRLLIETDGPFLAPVPHRGKQNEPAFVRYVAEKIGELWDCSPERVAAMTGKNADRLFEWR